jgi:hypothetical protein
LDPLNQSVERLGLVDLEAVLDQVAKVLGQGLRAEPLPEPAAGRPRPPREARPNRRLGQDLFATTFGIYGKRDRRLQKHIDAVAMGAYGLSSQTREPFASRAAF